MHIQVVSGSIATKSREEIPPLCLVLVRPQLDYCVQFSSPLCKKDNLKLKNLEQAQHRVTNMIRDWARDMGVGGVCVSELHRTRGDLTAVFDYLTGRCRKDYTPPSWKYAVRRQEVMDIKWSWGRLQYDMRNFFFVPWGWSSTGTGAQRLVKSSSLEMCKTGLGSEKPELTASIALHGVKDWTSDFQRSLPT